MGKKLLSSPEVELVPRWLTILISLYECVEGFPSLSSI